MENEMSKTRKGVSILFIPVFSLLTALLMADNALASGKVGDDQIQKIKKAIEVIEEIMEIPEDGIPEALLRKAYGIAIIPGVMKAAYGIGGQFGKGILVVRTKRKEWSNPCFIKLAGGSFGFQIGVQKTDIILVFKSKGSIEGITSGKVTLGADASIAAGPVGRHAEASTDIEFEAEIYSYSKSHGLFAGISIKGAALQIDEKANSAFYRTSNYTASDIFMNKEIEVPGVTEELRKVLIKYAKTPKNLK